MLDIGKTKSLTIDETLEDCLRKNNSSSERVVEPNNGIKIVDVK